MIIVIAICDGGEANIGFYQTDNVEEAKRLFVQDWIDGKIQWQYFEFYGPNCDVENPAFTPDFLREYGFVDLIEHVDEEGVTIHKWVCVTSPSSEQSHCVTGYFIPSNLKEITRSDQNNPKAGINFVGRESIREKASSVIAIIDYNGLETHILKYKADNIFDAKDMFLQDWINGNFRWTWREFYGPFCDSDNPIFDPKFLEEYKGDDGEQPLLYNGVYIWEWWCITDEHGSDEHMVAGYFVGC